VAHELGAAEVEAAVEEAAPQARLRLKTGQWKAAP
jgi:hypothetical protein